MYIVWSRNKSEKIFLVIIAVSVIFLLLLAIFLFNYRSEASELDNFAKKTEAFIQEKGGNKNLKIEVFRQSVKKGEPKDVQYKNLILLFYDFDSEYVISRDPEIREYATTTIRKFAESNYPKQFREVDFTIRCSDPVCGQETDAELKEIMNAINQSDIDEAEKTVINRNLTTASYVPDDELDNKLIGFTIVYQSLMTYGSKSASDTAKKLNSYSMSRYQKSLE